MCLESRTLVVDGWLCSTTRAEVGGEGTCRELLIFYLLRMSGYLLPVHTSHVRCCSAVLAAGSKDGLRDDDCQWLAGGVSHMVWLHGGCDSGHEACRTKDGRKTEADGIKAFISAGPARCVKSPMYRPLSSRVVSGRLGWSRFVQRSVRPITRDRNVDASRRGADAKGAVDPEALRPASRLWNGADGVTTSALCLAVLTCFEL